MLVQQMVVLGYVPVVKIGDAEIKDDVEKEGKVQDHKIEAVISYPNTSLYG